MHELILDVGDLAETRFALSPLLETVLSLRIWHQPGYYVRQRPWLAAAARGLGDLDITLLLALVGPRRLVPDFLTPRPGRPFTDFTTELDRARACDPDRVAADIRAAHAGGTLPDLLGSELRRPARLRDRLADLLQTYWTVTIAPHWPRLRGVLEADLRYRASRLADGGAALLFADLDPAITFHHGRLRTRLNIPHIDTRTPVTGRGLCLVPTLFVNAPGTPNNPEHPPMIIYPARGSAIAWQPPPPAPAVLAALIGAPKAAILTALVQPRSTTDLAHLLAVTPSAISHHLKTLHAAGLVGRARAGRSVLYTRTALADQLTS
ncbi:ArsR/SmtB family transcription factor [Streptosporangium sp. NBC_01756]|uniref:ArsR/SmtB family transcription factor n=1 Tax=Streptosporangium sp. NBC_01756 TaxID=2975950 RepID=UPI002DDB2514|nr:DUF5937 family protein [Streptosporangium sp. NBC_01756]WSC86273.1 helix-turn-helix domain-containing protein [Streptosporangium sp. NBC_01756]